MLTVLLACNPPVVADKTVEPPTMPHVPAHSVCLADGEYMSDDTCLAVIELDDRFPGTSYDKSGVSPASPDPRQTDPDLAQLYDDIRQCTCSCCHQSTLGGPGVFFWDLDFGPFWIDSASDWSLEVLAGLQYSENQQLPHENPEWVQMVIQAELDRRE